LDCSLVKLVEKLSRLVHKVDLLGVLVVRLKEEFEPPKLAFVWFNVEAPMTYRAIVVV
jgi:hypothetical protein